MILTTNTLMDISKHSNKTVKFAKYIIDLKQDIIINKLQHVDENGNEVDYIDAFHNDLNDTTKMIVDVHQLLSTVDENGDVLHLIGEKNLSKVFGDAYDNDKKIIHLPFGELNLKENCERNVFKALILYKTTGLNIEDYERLHKNRKKLYELDEKNLSDNDEKIEFLASLAGRNEFKEPLRAIKKLISNNMEFRKSLGVENKRILDDKITFTKAMLDGITKASLYVTTNDGVVQWGSGFKKKHKDAVDDIVKELSENPYIESVELDVNTQPTAFLNLMKDIKKLKLKIGKPITLKSRKMDIYNKNGSYTNALNMVALNVRKASAGMHELIHAIIETNPNIKNSYEMMALAKYLRTGRMDEELLKKENTAKKFKYYTCDDEIIARCGEIAYLFKKYEYKPDEESYDTFKERVQENQKIKVMYDLNIIKDIEFYEERSHIYFDIKTIEAKDVKLICAFYDSLYDLKMENELKPFEDFAMPVARKHRVVGTRTPFESKAISTISSENINTLLEYNDKNKVVDPAALMQCLTENSLYLSRSKKKITQSDLNEQNLIFEKICKWAFENDKFYEMSRLVESMAITSKELSIDEVALTKKAIEDPNLSIKESVFDEIENLKVKAKPFFDKKEEILKDGKDKRSAHIEVNILSNKYDVVLEEVFEKSANSMRDELKNNELHTYLYNLGKNSNNTEKNRSIDLQYLRKRKAIIFNMFLKSIEKDGNEILNYFDKDDLFPLLNIFNNDDKDFYNVKKIIRGLDNKPDDINQNIFDPHRLLGYFKESGMLTSLVSSNKQIDLKYAVNILNQFREYSYSENSLSDKRKLFLDTIDDNETIKSIVKDFSLNKNLFQGKLKEDISIEDAIAYIDSIEAVQLPKYQEIQQEILDLKESFSVGMEKQDPVIKTEPVPVEIDQLESKEAPVDNTAKNTEPVKAENDEPVDPNNQDKLPKQKKTRGRKKVFNPNQRSLW